MSRLLLVQYIAATFNSCFLTCNIPNALHYLDVKNQFRAMEEFRPNPSSISANLKAVKGNHVENGLVL